MTERDRIIQDNLKLVHSCCKRFKNKGIEYDDLFSAGCIGLVKSTDKFDKTLGYAFSTYAVPVILGEIKRLFREDGTLKVGRRIKENARTVNIARESLSSTLGREPTLSELSLETGLSAEQIVCADGSQQSVLSLDYTNEDGKSSGDFVCLDKSDEMIGSIALKQSIDSLSDQDRKLIILRYYKNRTQSLTAEELGMTQVQVSRREKVILKQLREKMLS